MTQISTIGLDLAKNVFQLHGVDAAGKVVLRRQLRRGQLEKFFAGLSLAWWGSRPVAALTIGRG
jgi:transposase